MKRFISFSWINRKEANDWHMKHDDWVCCMNVCECIIGKDANKKLDKKAENCSSVLIVLLTIET